MEVMDLGKLALESVDLGLGRVHVVGRFHNQEHRIIVLSIHGEDWLVHFAIDF